MLFTFQKFPPLLSIPKKGLDSVLMKLNMSTWQNLKLTRTKNF